MGKWIGRILLAIVIVFAGYAGWDHYKAGFHNLPDLPDGAFPISFKSGLKAVVVDIPNERETRRYFGFPLEVPYYLEDVWSFCRPPTEEELADAEKFIADRNMPGERFEAVCKIKADKDVVVRGLISRPC